MIGIIEMSKRRSETKKTLAIVQGTQTADEAFAAMGIRMAATNPPGFVPHETDVQRVRTTSVVLMTEFVRGAGETLQRNAWK